MCVNSVLLLQVQCPDTPPSLRGLNTKAPLSPSIRHSRHKAGFLDNFTLNWKDKMYKCTLFTFFNNIPMKTAFVLFDLNTFNFQTFYLVSQSYKALASERILYFISPIYLQFIVNNFLVIWKEKCLIRLSFPIRWNQETEIPSKKVVLESSEFVERGPKASVKWKNLATNIFEQWFPTK